MAANVWLCGHVSAGKPQTAPAHTRNSAGGTAADFVCLWRRGSITIFHRQSSGGAGHLCRHRQRDFQFSAELDHADVEYPIETFVASRGAAGVFVQPLSPSPSERDRRRHVIADAGLAHSLHIYLGAAPGMNMRGGNIGGVSSCVYIHNMMEILAIAAAPDGVVVNGLFVALDLPSH